WMKSAATGCAHSSASAPRLASFSTRGGSSPGHSSVTGMSCQPRLGALSTVPESRATRPGTAITAATGRSPSAAASATADPASAESRASTPAGGRAALGLSTTVQTRTWPRRSVTHTPRCSTPTSRPSPAGPRSLTMSALPGRPTRPLAAGPSSVSSPAASSSSTRLDTAGLVSPGCPATAALDTGPCLATVSMTRARLCRRMLCCDAGRVLPLTAALPRRTPSPGPDRNRYGTRTGNRRTPSPGPDQSRSRRRGGGGRAPAGSGGRWGAGGCDACGSFRSEPGEQLTGPGQRTGDPLHRRRVLGHRLQQLAAGGAPAAGDLVRGLAGEQGGGLGGGAEGDELGRRRDHDRPPGQAQDRLPPGRALGAAADEQQGRGRVGLLAAGAEHVVERGQQGGGGAVVGGLEDLAGGGVVAQRVHEPGGVRQVGGALAVEERQHDDAAAGLDRLPVAAEQARHLVDGLGAVERAGQRQPV